MVAVKKSAPVIEPQRRQLNFVVTERVYQGVCKQASKLDMSPTRYAQSLFEAAYAARIGGTGDPVLEAVVGAALVLWGLNFDVPTIAKSLNVTEPQVEMLISRWQMIDRRDRKAA